MENTYIQQYVDINPWDNVHNKTIISTRFNAAIIIKGGIFQILTPPNKLVAQAPVTSVTASVSGLAKLGAAVLVDLGGQKWMIDFGRVPMRTQSGGLKKFLSAFNPASGFQSVKKAKLIREQFLIRLKELGGSVNTEPQQGQA